jgi:uncharacterized protein
MSTTPKRVTPEPKQARTQTPKQTALVTGASSGIGEVLAKQFAAAGFEVILVARNAEKLKALAGDITQTYGVAARVEVADLSERGAAARLCTSLTRKRCKVDLLVNCAGVLEYGAFTHISAEKHAQMIELNILGLTAMLTAFLPAMVKRGSGRVLNVASIAAFQPIPMLATYAATKAYVLSLSESLAEELRGTGVSVTTLCPGITATAMLTKAATSHSAIGKLPSFLIGDVEAVAAQAVKACLAGDVICVPGAVNRVATLASRSTPKWLVRRLGGLVGRKTV